MDGKFFKSDFFKGRLIEFLVCLPLGLIVSIVLVRMFFCSIKPLIESYNNMMVQQEVNYDSLDAELSKLLK